MGEGLVLRAGEVREVEVEELDPSGAGIAVLRDESRAWRVAVPGALPGERCRVRVEHVSPRAVRGSARLVEIVRALPGRRDPPCPRDHRRDGQCTGCPLMNVDVLAQREIKRETAWRQYGIALDRVVGGEPFGYRLSSKRVVGGRRGSVVLGSYRRGSHEIADMRGCLVDHPAIVECFDQLRLASDAEGVEPYDERTGHGDLRYVWAKCDGTRVLLTLVTASVPSHAAAVLPVRLTRAAGVAWSVQPSVGNAIRGGEARVIAGRDRLELSLAGVEVPVGPLGFLQPNPPLAVAAYEALVSEPNGDALSGRVALDLYAGAGVVTARLRQSFADVRPCESFAESASMLGVEPLEADAFLARQIGTGVRPDLIVANPPRAGMGDTVCSAICELAPTRVGIMSCNLSSLVRDLGVLRHAYDVICARAFDTLPQTAHLEVVVWLRRRPNSGA